MTGQLPIRQIRRLARDERFLVAMGETYAALDARVAARGPVCMNRGDCCKFGLYGHRLYVTPAELAFFMATRPHSLPVPADATGCPYQVGERCTARDGRPMGCRVFFCEVKSQHWQPDETEATLRQIKELHRRFGLPYAYVEWLDALRQFDETPVESC